MAFIMVFFNFTLSYAEIYRYVDGNGIVSYSDIPGSRNAEKISKAGPPVLPKNNETMPMHKEVHAIVTEKAKKYDIDPSLVYAVIKAESNGNPYAVSRKGAMGLMQLMPVTANELQVSNPFDPEENIDGGIKYLKYLIDKFNGDLVLALAAYNAGPKAVEKTGSVPHISETKQYVKRVLSLYNGKTTLPVSSSAVYAGQKTDTTIYKVIAEDGTVLFTNSPLYKKYPRL